MSKVDRLGIRGKIEENVEEFISEISWRSWKENTKRKRGSI